MRPVDWLNCTVAIFCFRMSKETREIIDIGKKKVTKYKGTDSSANQEKEKKRVARNKERRAVLILGQFFYCLDV